MNWKPARFKDSDVWVAVDASGEVAVERGRVPMRYNLRPGAKIYKAAHSRVQLDPDGAVQEVDDAAARGSAGSKKRSSGFGKAGTRTKSQAAAAKAEAARLLADLPEGTVVAYTDGACRGNPGPAGSGAVVEVPGRPRLEGCRSLGRATNNVAELTAVDLALDLLERLDLAPDAPVALLTDSDYTNGVLCRGWKAKANRELIHGLRERLAARPGVVLHWVAGHVGVSGNERADELANLGVDGQSFVRDEA